MNRLACWTCLLVVSLVAGCASSPDDEQLDRRLSAQELYEESRKALQRGDTDTALINLETLQVRFPQNNYALQAQLDIILAYYQAENYDTAISAARQFRQLNPSSPHGAYALYMIGRSEAAKLDGIFDKYVARDFADYDRRVQSAALQAYERVIREYPSSDWTEDARARSEAIIADGAHHELKTAKYYFERGAYVGAANRINALLSLYPDSEYTVEGLVVLHDSYRAQGLVEQSDSVRELIATADPEHALAAK
ncbi:MAG: outer membrane protein assembly factor BamD [Pseudomonadota bacterium]